MTRPQNTGFLVAVATTGLLAGWLAGRSGRSPADDAGSSAATAVDAGKRARQSATTGPDASASGGGVRTCAAYVRRVSLPAEKQEAAAIAARMSAAELRTLLLSAPPRPWGAMAKKEDFVKWVMLDAAAEELFAREGMTAVEWAQACGLPQAHQALLRALCMVDPAAGKPLVEAMARSGFNGSPWVILQAAAAAAAMRGADDLLALERLWPDIPTADIAEFPPDFDWARYLRESSSTTGSDGRTGRAVAMKNWAASEPSAAAAALLEGMRTDGGKWDTLAASALQGRAMVAGEEDAARWLAGVMAQDGGRWEQMVQIAGSSDSTDSRTAAIIRSMPYKEAAMTSGRIVGDLSGRVSQAAAALGSLEPAAQTAAITESLQTARKRYLPPRLADQYPKRMEAILDAVSLPEEQRARIQANIEEVTAGRR